MSIDHAARLDVHDLLARFCQFLDHGASRDWAELFLGHGVFECGASGTWAGSAQLELVPGVARARWTGEVRHLISAVTIDPGESWRDLEVRAYGPVIDLDRGGALSAFYDYEFKLRYACRWRIRHAVARTVGIGFNEFGGAYPPLANAHQVS